MRLLMLLASLAAAQALPDAPKPQPPSLESGLTEMRSGFSAPGYVDWQKRKQQESFKSVGVSRGVNDPERRFGSLRFDTAQLTIHVLQPAPGVKLGAFYAVRDASDGARPISHDVRKGASLTIQLSGERKKEPFFHFPFAANYTETELSARRVRVQGEDFDKGFKELKP